ncbi:MAG: hypothetical protein M4D80_42400 [Myxococcota bacterium]|nr:hypothetical protein [Myxococcota bacterium]
MRGSIGIVIGLIGGAGGMYLALRPPWGGGATTPSSEPGVVSTVPGDAGAGNAKPGKKRTTKKRPTGSTTVATGNEEFEETEPELPPLSDTDRRLEWRGDDVTLPATRIDMGARGDARPLEDNEINSTINAQSGAVRDCVVTGATGTDLRATITVKLVVDGNGKVTKSKLHAPRYLFEKGLLNCTQKALRTMKFPATGAATLVTLPVGLG